MTRLEANLQILGLLSHLAAQNKDLRFGQLLSMISAPQPLFYSEGDEIITRLKELVKNDISKE